VDKYNGVTFTSFDIGYFFPKTLTVFFVYFNSGEIVSEKADAEKKHTQKKTRINPNGFIAYSNFKD
jgi:hypothetical protein